MSEKNKGLFSILVGIVLLLGSSIGKSFLTGTEENISVPIVLPSATPIAISSYTPEKTPTAALTTKPSVTATAETSDASALMPTVTPTDSPTITPTPTATPTATPEIVNYRIKDIIDLSGGSLTAMAIYRTDGVVIKSTWASAIIYQDGDSDEVFDPHAGTIYSHDDGGYLATWVHSGELIKGKLFAYDLEKSVWLNEKAKTGHF